MKSNHLSQAWLVITLAAIFGGALAGVELALRDRIAENKRNEMLNQVPILVPESTHGDIDNALSEQYGKLVAKALDKDGKVVGYVFVACGDGFADKIELIIGINPTLDEIKGIYVLTQKETPGLGNKIVESDFRDQFRGKSVATPVSASKKPKDNQIGAITAATISSTAVCNIINKGVNDFKKALLARAEAQTKKAATDNQEGGVPDGE